MATEAQTIANRRPTLTPHPSPLTPNLFMQNKPNFRNDKMNISSALAKDYENETAFELRQNKPNQTQFQPKNEANKPNQTQFYPKNGRATPRIIGTSADATGLVQAAKITGCGPSAPLVLPLSIVSTEVKCGGADFDSSGDISFPDFAIFASAWQSSPGDGNWNPACDISEPSDDVINSLDLDVLTQYWLETGCL